MMSQRASDRAAEDERWLRASLCFLPWANCNQDNDSITHRCQVLGADVAEPVVEIIEALLIHQEKVETPVIIGGTGSDVI